MVEDTPNETPDTVKNTPAYRRMLKRERIKQEKKASMLENQGPITILVVGIIDFAIDIFKFN